MKPITLADETHLLKSASSGIAPLSVRFSRHLGDEVMSAAFALTPDERIAIANGAAVFVHVLGIEWAPLKLTVEGSAEWEAIMKEG